MQFTYLIKGNRVALILDPAGRQVGDVEAGVFQIDAHLRLSINDWKSLMTTVEEASSRLCE
jgi:hypothetical protein